VPISNSCRFVMLINDMYPVNVTQGGRRFVVLQPSDKRKGDVAYFDRLAKAVYDDEACRHCFNYLLTVDLGNWDPQAFDTTARKEMRENSLPTPIKFLVDIHSHGR